MNHLTGREGELAAMPRPRIGGSALQRYWPEDSGIESGISLKLLIQLWKQRKALVICTFLVLTSVITAGALLRPRKYEAEIQMLFKKERVDQPVLPENRVQASLPPEVSDTELASEMALLEGQDLLEKVVDKCGLVSVEAGSPSQRQVLTAKAIRRLAGGLSISQIRKTNIVSVKYSSTDPALAAQVLNELVSLYLEKHASVHRNIKAFEFFGRETDLNRQALQAARKELADYHQRYRVSLLEDEKRTLLQRSAELEARLQENGSLREGNKTRADYLLKQLLTLPAAIETQSRTASNELLMEKLKSLLLELENRRSSLVAKYDPKYRPVQEIDEQIRTTRQTLEKERNLTLVDRTQALNPIRQSVESELVRMETESKGLAAQRESLLRSHEETRSRQRILEEITAGNARLENQVKIAEENYLLYNKKREESRIANVMDQQKILNVSIIQPAKPPVLPSNTSLLIVLPIGAALAAFASLAAGGIADHINRPVRNQNELLEISRLPLLATVSKGQHPCL